MIGRICERLDGIPLAIELAAARTRSMTPADLADRLDDRFRLLAGGRRGAPERHQTLRATVEWSYRLLDERERRLFNRLAVFAGSFDLSAVEAVCGDDDLDRLDIAGQLAALVDRSMVVADRSGPHARYRLLETLRQFGEEQLEGTKEWDDIHSRHVEHFVHVVGIARLRFEGTTNVDGAAMFRVEWDNIRAALHWAISVGDAEAASTLVEAPFWFAGFGLRHELGEWAHLALQLPGSSPNVRGVAAFFAAAQGNHAQAIRLAEAGLATDPQPDGRHDWICRYAFSVANWYAGQAADAWASAQELNTHVDPLRDRFFAAVSAGGLGRLATVHQPAAAASYTAQARRIAVSLANPTLDAYLAWAEGNVARASGDYDLALDYLQQALDLATETQNPFLEGMTVLSMAFLANITHAPDAGDTFQEGITRFYVSRDWINMWPAIEGLSLYWLDTGRREPAAVLLGYLESRDLRYSPYLDQRDKALVKLNIETDTRTWISRGGVRPRPGRRLRTQPTSQRIVKSRRPRHTG